MSERVRVLFIVFRLATVNRGVETFVLELSSRLDVGRFAITMLSGLHQARVLGVAFEQGQLLARERLAWLDRIPLLGGIWTYRFSRKAFPTTRIVSIGQAGPVRTDLERSDILVWLMPHGENRAREMRPGLPTCVIPNGVDIECISPAARSGGAGRTILCTTALVPASAPSEQAQAVQFDWRRIAAEYGGLFFRLGRGLQ